MNNAITNNHPIKRHDLVYIDKSCMESIRGQALSQRPQNAEKILSLLIQSDSIQIPGIMKRQEKTRPGYTQLGFSSPDVTEGVRFRFQADVPDNSIVTILKPVDVYTQYLPCCPACVREALLALAAAAAAANVSLGIYGSLALSMVTSLGYFRPDSDLDLYISKNSPNACINGFYREVLNIQREYGICADIELEYHDTYGIKLKELYSGQRTVLAKGLYDVILLPVNLILDHA